jgi:cytochrome c2
MALRETFIQWLRPLVFLGRNVASLVGAVLTTSSGATLVGFWAFQIITEVRIPPYFGVIFYLILPALFVIGLILIPLGVLWRRNKLRSQGALPSIYPQINLRDPLLKRAAYWLGSLTVLNVVMVGSASYRGVEYMDSVSFCGQTCHTVMQPEYTAYLNSPHSRVACVSCHIGPGASWFVRSKLSGVRQVFAVLLHTYETPIPTPVENLRPAQETCEQCHWPEMFQGDKLLIRTTYGDDEKNTPSTTVLMMKIGGMTWERAVGIHGRHLDPPRRVKYTAIDRARQIIPKVTYTEDNGTVVDFTSSDQKVTPEQLAKGETRTMDCVDCHNRPTHTFHLAGDAVDQAMSESHIDPTLPFIKKKAVEVLDAQYPDRETAQRQIASSLDDFYRSKYPDAYQKQKRALETSIAEVQSIYLRNIFPDMKVTWGTYVNNIGHVNSAGCFRCHDGSHVSKDGNQITQDCAACHALLAIQEQNPQILSQLQVRNSGSR